MRPVFGALPALLGAEASRVFAGAARQRQAAPTLSDGVAAGGVRGGAGRGAAREEGLAGPGGGRHASPS